MASHWIPQDDFLLRKSIENGASLESLAKGAIKFSRKFTLSELTERWRSLLYDPNVKSLSSSIGFDFHYSTQFLPQTNHRTTKVRSHYYTTARKRMRVEDEPLNNYNEDLNHVAYGGFGDHNNVAVDHLEDAFGVNSLQGLDLYEDLGFDESQFEILRSSFPEIMQDHDNDDDGDRIMNQLLNINDGQIQDSNVLFQEEFQDPHFQQQHNTSFYEKALVTHHQQEETWIAPESYPSKPEEYCHNAIMMPLSEWDPHPEIKDGVIICTLNRASDEIPDNDDFNPQLHPRARNSINHHSSSLRKHMKPPLPPIRISSSSPSQAKGNDIVHSYGFATQASYSYALKESFTTEKATSSVAITTTPTPLQHSLENEIMLLSKEMDIKNASMSEEEENNNDIESDEDLPSYSDVEAMILDMELETVGQDQYELEASRYRNEEAMRMIMRLEQSSASYMNRDIASHGAFAILYGSSKHYIKKREVLLGRATGEYPVDIDLGRSGSETKVSRRQAVIKLKQDGCFEIKNLGKFSIWMNDKEIEHGEVVTLKNHCLIQIREMSFIFETNEKAVKRYLNGIQR